MVLLVSLFGLVDFDLYGLFWLVSVVLGRLMVLAGLMPWVCFGFKWCGGGVFG